MSRRGEPGGSVYGKHLYNIINISVKNADQPIAANGIIISHSSLDQMPEAV